MSAKTIHFLSASAAPNRRHFAVPALLLAPLAAYGGPAFSCWHFLPSADVRERFGWVMSRPIVPARSDRHADSLLPHRPLHTLWNHV